MACFSLKRKEPLSHEILFGVCKAIFVMMNRYCIMWKAARPFLNVFFWKTRWIFFSAPRISNRCMILHQNPLLYRYGTCNYGLGYLLPWFVSSYYTTSSFSRQSDDNFVRKQIYEFIDESNRWVGAFLDRCIERLICLSQRYNVVNRLHLKGSHLADNDMLSVSGEHSFWVWKRSCLFKVHICIYKYNLQSTIGWVASGRFAMDPSHGHHMETALFHTESGHQRMLGNSFGS